MSKLHREITITPIGVYVEQAIRVHNNNARGISKDAIAILNYLTDDGSNGSNTADYICSELKMTHQAFSKALVELTPQFHPLVICRNVCTSDEPELALAKYDRQVGLAQYKYNPEFDNHIQ